MKPHSLGGRLLALRRLILIAALLACPCVVCLAQSLGNAGTIQGSVVDPSSAAVPSAHVVARNPLTGYSQQADTGSDGAFRMQNLPPNAYHLEITAPGFAASALDIEIRNSLPVPVKVMLALAGNRSSVEVEAAGADLLETTPSSHVDVERSLLMKMPSGGAGAGLGEAACTITERRCSRTATATQLSTGI